MNPWDDYLHSRQRRDELRDLVHQKCLLAETGRRGWSNKLADQVGLVVAEFVVASVLGQHKLIEKFGDGIWVGTQRGIMQSTTARIANLKASWMQGADVVDLCCGIGGDAVALARRGHTAVVDQDPSMVVAAMMNANVDQGDVADVNGWAFGGPMKGDHAIHIDPDRREDNVRHSRVEDYQPSWDQTRAIIDGAPAAMVKLAPAAEMDDALGHRAWLSTGGTVREQTLLVGDAIAGAGVSVDQRSAWRIRHNDTSTSFQSRVDVGPAGGTDGPLEWMIDPDRAIRAAGLTDAFGRRFELMTIGGPSGFLTTTEQKFDRHRDAIESMAVAANVSWRGSVDDRKLRRVLRQNDFSIRTVKVRGGGDEPAAMVRRYRDLGQQPVTLWIGTQGRKKYAVITPDVQTVDVSK